MAFEDVTSIHQCLLERLDAIGAFEECALLGYPEHHNVGDHLIWLGALRWIRQIRGARLSYVSSIGEFSQQRLNGALRKGPIVLTGGGNFGDHWPRDQRFREAVVRANRDRSVIILPQSLYFSTPDSAQTARRIFNEHPDLTLFARDDVSFEKAKKYFPNAKIFLAPDMSLMHAGEWGPSAGRPDKILCLRRHDREQSCEFQPEEGSPSLTTADWPGMTPWTRFLQRIVRHLPSSLRWAQAVHRADPIFDSPDAFVKKTLGYLDGAPDPAFQRRSLRIVAQAAQFLRQYGLVASDRLHGHLFSVLLGIPNVFLPNAYHKNEAFFRCWTAGIPYCRFAADAGEARQAMRELAARG